MNTIAIINNGIILNVISFIAEFIFCFESIFFASSSFSNLDNILLTATKFKTNVVNIPTTPSIDSVTFVYLTINNSKAAAPIYEHVANKPLSLNLNTRIINVITEK